MADSTTPSAGAAFPRAREDWRRALTGAERARLQELHRLSFWTRGKALLLIAIWLACAVVAIRVHSLWVRLPLWLVIGLALHGLGVLMHEAAHRSLFRNPSLDRIVGFFLGLPLFFSCSCYRATHMLHHQYENTALDPDHLATAMKQRQLRLVVFYGWFLVGTPPYIVLLSLVGWRRARGAADKAACVIEPLLIAAFYVALFTCASRYHFGQILADGWGWALPFAILIANARGLAEHTQIAHDNPPEPIRSTRSLTSTRIVSFFFNNQNYHLEHHLFPAIPWNNLPKIREFMQPVLDAHQAPVEAGYFRWLLNAWRYGPDRSLHYRNGRGYLNS